MLVMDLILTDGEMAVKALIIDADEKSLVISAGVAGQRLAKEWLDVSNRSPLKEIIKHG